MREVFDQDDVREMPTSVYEVGSSPGKSLRVRVLTSLSAGWCEHGLLKRLPEGTTVKVEAYIP